MAEKGGARKGGASKSESRFWSGIKPGDYVSLSDSQSFLRGGTAGVDYRVRDARRIVIQERDGGREVAEYHLFDLELEGAVVLYFMVVQSGEDFELRAYFRPEGLPAGTRTAPSIKARPGSFFPARQRRLHLVQLEYAPFPDVPPIDEGKGPVTRVFAPAGFGKAVYGYYLRERQEVPVILVEYAAKEEDALNPLLLVLEERWMRPDGSVPEEGGLVTPLLGCPIDPDNADVFPA